MTKPRVLLADDHQILAEGLKSILEHEFEIVGIAANGRDLVEQAKRLHPDVIVADISMPELNGIDALKQLKEGKLRSRTVFLTMHPDAAYVSRALKGGASGYVLKHAPRTELIAAIREAMAGGTYVSPEIADAWTNLESAAEQTPGDVLARLTTRQREVLQLFAEGRIAKEVAAILKISRRTAEFHKARLMKELGIHSTAELTQFAIKHGIISID